MAPEFIIAAVSASCGVLLVVGSLVVGRATAEMAFRKKRAELQATIGSLREKVDAAQAEVDSKRRGSEDSEVLDAEMAKAEKQALEELRAKLTDVESKLEKAELAADEADKEFSIVRDKLDQTEKRLAEANRRLAEVDGGASAPTVDEASAAKLTELERQLEEAKKATARLATIEKERDQALRRIRELDKKPNDEARIRSLEEQVKTAEATEVKLRSQLQAEARAEASAPKDSGQVDKLREELAAANERLVVSERVMEGVRARSNMLSQELKKVKAELAALKG